MQENYNVLFLDNQLCFPLYVTSRLTTKLYTPHLKKLEITYPQYLVLLVLWQYKDQSVSKIGERLFLESNTLTPLLKRLEQKNIIVKSQSKDDERKILISLTPKGENLKDKALEIPTKIFEIFKSDDFSEQEIIGFQKTLVKLVKKLNN